MQSLSWVGHNITLISESHFTCGTEQVIYESYYDMPSSSILGRNELSKIDLLPNCLSLYFSDNQSPLVETSVLGLCQHMTNLLAKELP